MTSILQCPVCREFLFDTAGGYQCANKHMFDAARQGYVNFHLAHQKHSKEPGDSADMIESRRRFLGLGLYNRVSDGINHAAWGNLPGLDSSRMIRVLDAGCGEGFYLTRLKGFIEHSPAGHASVEYYGVDISKYAVRKATQRDKTMNWFVASIVGLPFSPSSIDVVLNIFAMADFAEFSRVLGEAGRLVIVSPGPRHLNGLREIIYPTAREHAPSAAREQAGGLFSPAATTRVNYQVELKSSREIMDLLAMTPYFWNIDLNTRSRVEALDRLALDVDVEIRVYTKQKK